MDRVKPPEFTDWIDTLMGTLVVIGGSAFAFFMTGVLLYW